MTDEQKEYRVYSSRKEGFLKKRTYCEGEVGARDERDAISKISASKGIPLEYLKAEPISQGCFVACAVYGGGDVEQVNVLREYRDKVLMQDEVGRRFVQWYYNGGGERMADFIRNRARFLIPIIRKELDYIVEDYKFRERSNLQDKK